MSKVDLFLYFLVPLSIKEIIKKAKHNQMIYSSMKIVKRCLISHLECLHISCAQLPFIYVMNYFSLPTRFGNPAESTK